MFLEKFILPDDEGEYKIGQIKRAENGGYLDNGYPCGLFTYKGLSEIDFDNITIFYGGNGSGKTTLLNIIANKLDLNRMSPYNDSELFSYYVNLCDYRLEYDEYNRKKRIPSKSKIITSDDVFDYMLAVRDNNSELADNSDKAKGDYASLKFGETAKFIGLENYEDYRLQVLSRQKSLSRRKFLRKVVGQEVKLNSNGETAIDFYADKYENDTLICLDEPENSLSPKMQLILKDMIERKARYCNCQFIIATHSPFILSLNGAKIYDLDSVPVMPKKWYEVESAKLYFDFFYKNKSLFLDDD